MQDLIEECIIGRIIFHERYWNGISQDAKDFILNLLAPVPENRFTCQVCPIKYCLIYPNDLMRNILNNII